MTMAIRYRLSAGWIRIHPSSPIRPTRSSTARRYTSCKTRAAESRGRDSDAASLQGMERMELRCTGRTDARVVCGRLQGGSELQDTERGDGTLFQRATSRDAPASRTRRGLEACAAGG